MRENAKDDLIKLEAVIDAGQQNFYAIGRALREIRDGRLYQKAGFSLFETYTKKRWELSKSQAYRLIEASSVIDNLSPIGEETPKREAHVRPLIQLDAATQRKVWWSFLNSGLAHTARNISKFVKKHTGETKETQAIDKIEIISDSYKAVVMAMLDQIRLAQNDRWEKTSRQAALYWNNVMKEKILWEVL